MITKKINKTIIFVISLLFVGVVTNFAYAVLDSQPILNEITEPRAIAPGDTLTVFGQNLGYTDANNTKICLDSGGACMKASDPEVLTWTSTQITIKPEVFNGSNYAIQDFKGGIVVYLDGVRINGWQLGNVPIYYLKPIINTVAVANNIMTITPQTSYTYNSFLAEIQAVIINGQEIAVSATGPFSITLPESLKNIGQATIKVRNLHGIESDPKDAYWCVEDYWSCGEWGSCLVDSTQTRDCAKTFDCSLVDTVPSSTSQSCTYVPPVCTSWDYSEWSKCQSDGTQSRTIINSFPAGCLGGTPILTQSCTYIPPKKPCDKLQFCSTKYCKLLKKICHKLSK